MTNNTPSDSGSKVPLSPKEMAAKLAAQYALPKKEEAAGASKASSLPTPPQLGESFAERMQSLRAPKAAETPTQAPSTKLSLSELFEAKKRNAAENALPESLDPAEQARAAMAKYAPKPSVPSDQAKTFNPHANITDEDVDGHLKAAKLALLDVLTKEKQSLFLQAGDLPFDELLHHIEDITKRGGDYLWEHMRLKMIIGKLWQSLYLFQDTTEKRYATDLETQQLIYTLLGNIPDTALNSIVPKQRENLTHLRDAYEREGIVSFDDAQEANVPTEEQTKGEYMDLDALMNPGMRPSSFFEEEDTSDIELDDNDKKQLLFYENFSDADLNRYFNQAKASPSNLLGVYNYFREFSFAVSKVLQKRPALESKRLTYATKIYEKFKELKAVQIGDIGLPEHSTPLMRSRPPQFTPLSSGTMGAPSVRVPSGTPLSPISTQAPTFDYNPEARGIKSRHKKVGLIRSIQVTESSTNETNNASLPDNDNIKRALQNSLASFDTSEVPRAVQEHLLVNMPYMAYAQIKDGTWLPYWKEAQILKSPLGAGLALGAQGIYREEFPQEAILRKIKPIAELVKAKEGNTITTSSHIVKVHLDEHQTLLLVPKVHLLAHGDSIELTVRDGEKKNQHVISKFYGTKLAVGEEFRTDLSSCNGFITDVQFTNQGTYRVTLIRINEQTQAEEYLTVDLKNIGKPELVPEYIRERLSGPTLSRTVDTDAQHFEQYDRYDIEFLKKSGLTKHLTQTRQLTEFHGDKSATMTLQCSPSFVMSYEDGSIVERVVAVSLCNPAENTQLFAELSPTPSDTPEEAEKKRLLVKDLSRIGLYMFEKDGSGWSVIEKETNVTIPVNKAITEILETIPNILRVDEESLENIKTLYETKTASSVKPRVPTQYEEAEARYELQNPDLQTFQSRLNALTRLFDTLSASEWRRGSSAPLATTAIPTQEILEAVIHDDALWHGIPGSQKEAFYNKLEELKNPNFKPQDDWLIDLGQRWNTYLKQVLKVGIGGLFDEKGTVVNQKFSRYPLRLPKSSTPLTVSVAIEQSEHGKLSEVMTSASFKRRDGVVKLEKTNAYHCYVKISSPEGDDLLIHVMKEKGKAPKFVDWSAHSLSNLVDAKQPLADGQGYKPLSHLPEFFQNIIGTRSLGFENLAPTFNDYMNGYFGTRGFEDDKFMLIPLFADIGALLTAVESGRAQQ